MTCCLDVLYPLLLLAILVYVVLPVVVKFTARLSKGFSVVPVEANMLPPNAAGHFGRVATSIGALGFAPAGFFQLSGMAAASDAMLALWTNAKTGEVAIGAVVTHRPAGRPELARTTRFTQYLTRFPDGVAIVTNNSPRLGAFRPARTHDVIHAPGIDSPAVLYRLHAAHVAALAPGAAEGVLPEPGREVEWLEQLLSDEVDTQVAAGNFQTAGGADYVPTWRGAFMMTYDQLPPMKQFRHAHEESRARPFADAAGVTL